MQINKVADFIDTKITKEEILKAFENDTLYPITLTVDAFLIMPECLKSLSWSYNWRSETYTHYFKYFAEAVSFLVQFELWRRHYEKERRET